MNFTPDHELTRRPSQVKALEMCRQAFREGHRQVIVCKPTGAGKSLDQRDMARGAIERGKSVALMLHRRVVRDQAIEQFKQQGIDYGIVAAGKEANPSAPVQICMIQTIGSRKGKMGFEMPKADLVIWDEIHAQKAGRCLEVHNHYKELKVPQVGFTATPVGCGGVATKLCVAANYTDCLNEGSHQILECFGPDRPDLSREKPKSNGEYSEKQCDRLIHKGTIFGRVFDHWDRLNPAHLPALNFASSTEAARWWVDEFAKKGILTGSIDHKEIRIARRKNIDGVQCIRVDSYENADTAAGQRAREELFTLHEEGTLRILHNRFVLSIAWDAPYVYHCVLSTPMASLTLYLQSVGRVMRCDKRYECKLLQDHGGVVDHLGMPNQDRDWDLPLSDAKMRQRDKKRIAEKKGVDAEPICCGKCGGWRTHGGQCPHCGHMTTNSVRPVVQLDGTLKKVVGRVVKHKAKDDCFTIWRGVVHGSGAVPFERSVSSAIKIASMRCEEKGLNWSPEHFPTKYRIPPKDLCNVAMRDWYSFLPRKKFGS